MPCGIDYGYFGGGSTMTFVAGRPKRDRARNKAARRARKRNR